MDFIINSESDNLRLDTFLRKRYREISLTGIFRMIRKGKVKVNGKKRKQNYRLQQGDRIQVWEQTLPSPSPALVQLTEEEKTLAASIIVYENKQLMFCNKPSGLVMHRGSGHKYGLAEMIQSHCQNPRIRFVHRIDRDTSGLVLAAKDLETARKLSSLIKTRAVEKTYSTLVRGRVAEDDFQLCSFLKKEVDRVAVHLDASQGAKEARSRFSILERGQETTLLEGRLITGRTHQLRVQLAHAGHPIIGDNRYGSSDPRGLFLFSQGLVIPSMELDISLPLPERFHTALT